MKVPLINPKTFFELIRNEFNITTNDKIILRLNCEGSEAEIIESIIKKFPQIKFCYVDHWMILVNSRNG